jgi:hypothetical protein
VATASRVLWRCGLGALVLLALGGCVGLVRNRLEWVPVTSAATTRAEVLGRFGAPRRTAHEAGREVWYYHLSGPGPSGQWPATEAATIAYVGLVPVWWRTRPDDNVRFAFDGERVAGAGELRPRERGFYCGATPVAGSFFMCGRVP